MNGALQVIEAKLAEVKERFDKLYWGVISNPDSTLRLKDPDKFAEIDEECGILEGVMEGLTFARNQIIKYEGMR